MKTSEVRRACSTYGWEGKYLQGLVAKPKRKKLIRKPRLRWEGNIKKDVKGIWWNDVAKGRDNLRTVVNAVMKFRVLQNSCNFLSSATAGFCCLGSGVVYFADHAEAFFFFLCPCAQFSLLIMQQWLTEVKNIMRQGSSQFCKQVEIE